MSQRDSTTETDEEPADERRVAGIDDALAEALDTVRSGVRSGAPAGAAGFASLLSGVRALRRDDRGHGYLRLGAGGLLLVIAIDQRRAARDRTGVESSDVVDTSPNTGTLEGWERNAGREDHAGGDAASEVARTSIDIEDAASSPESGDAEREPDAAEVAEPEAYEQLGAAAFDEHSSEVPVPQPAFDRTILSLGSEVFWGIREADDAVVVSGQFDPIQDGDGIRYVASSEVDGERSLTVPDTVLNHWDAVAGGGLAVASGDDLVFLTTDSLQADDQLRVVPEQWLEDVIENGE
ncbi:hypothetical protein [Natrinema thermotolerans]